MHASDAGGRKHPTGGCPEGVASFCSLVTPGGGAKNTTGSAKARAPNSYSKGAGTADANDV